MLDVKVFNNKEFGSVRTLDVNGEPYFVGKDICQVFGDKNHNRSIGRLDDEDKSTTEILDSMGRKQTALVVNESGLYSLLFSMQPQKANSDGVTNAYPTEVTERIERLHKFKRWVTNEVLPSIRKHGAYMNDDTLEQALTNPDFLIKLATELKAEKAKRKELELSNSQLTVENHIMQPKAEYFDALVERNTLTNFRETAKLLQVKEKKFIQFLLNKKFVYRDAKGRLTPYAEKNDGLFETKGWFNNSTKVYGTQNLITPKGREVFRLLCEGE